MICWKILEHFVCYWNPIFRLPHIFDSSLWIKTLISDCYPLQVTQHFLCWQKRLNSCSFQWNEIDGKKECKLVAARTHFWEAPVWMYFFLALARSLFICNFDHERTPWQKRLMIHSTMETETAFAILCCLLRASIRVISLQIHRCRTPIQLRRSSLRRIGKEMLFSLINKICNFTGAFLSNKTLQSIDLDLNDLVTSNVMENKRCVIFHVLCLRILCDNTQNYLS